MKFAAGGVGAAGAANRGRIARLNPGDLDVRRPKLRARQSRVAGVNVRRPHIRSSQIRPTKVSRLHRATAAAEEPDQPTKSARASGTSNHHNQLLLDEVSSTDGVLAAGAPVGVGTGTVPSVVGAEAANPGKDAASAVGTVVNPALGDHWIWALRPDEVGGIDTVDRDDVGGGIAERAGDVTTFPPGVEHLARQQPGTRVRIPIDRRTAGCGEVAELADTVGHVVLVVGREPEFAARPAPGTSSGSRRT